MIRVALAVAGACLCLLPAAAMVGGAQPAGEGLGRAVVMLTGSHGTFCSGVALARDLVLTAGHCVLPGATYKLIEFDAVRQPALRDIANIARHPEFDVTAVLRHRVSANFQAQAECKSSDDIVVELLKVVGDPEPAKYVGKKKG